jgi:hypothetical protein
MTDNVMPFPGGEARKMSRIDEHFAAIDGSKENLSAIMLMAVTAIAGAGDIAQPGSTGEDARRFADNMTRAWFAIGELLGAKRDLMVKALR